MMSDKRIARFRMFTWMALIAVLILIWIGASVRASGAGMGCPDWPKCFGQWIPPMSESALPADYQKIYADRGYADTRFNLTKTLTEYLNRLAGVLVGLIILLMALFSIPARRSHSRAFKSAWASLFAVCLQGWIGAQVVASQLSPGIITVHMLMALLIIGLITYTLMSLYDEHKGTSQVLQQQSVLFRWSIVIISLSIVQIILGTQVREIIDTIANGDIQIDRSEWVDALPWFFKVHRSFSLIVLAANAWFVWKIYQSFGRLHLLTIMGIGLVSSIVFGVLSGASLNHLGFPMLVQPLHLLMATIIFTLQFTLLYRLKP